MARKYLSPSDAIVAVLTPQPSGKPVSSKSFGGAESLAGKPERAGGAAVMGAASGDAA